MFNYLIILLPFIAHFGFITTNIISLNPWPTKDIIAPGKLASLIKNNENIPVILNIGPSGAIKGSLKIGSIDNAKGLELLNNQLNKIPKNKIVIVYCGCCPYEHCPNIGPAYSILQKQGFINKKLLDLPVNLKVDWIDKGYPME